MGTPEAGLTGALSHEQYSFFSRGDMRTICGLAVSLLMLALAWADLAADVRKCSIDKNGVTRLACYDKLTPQAEASDPGLSLGQHGKWFVHTETSKIDDSRNAIAMLQAEEAIEGPRKKFTPTMNIRCKEKKTDAYIVTGMPATVEYGNVDGATITLRIDKQPSFKLNTSRATSDDALFLPQPIAQIKRLLAGKTVLFEFVPFNSSSVMTTFDLRGMAEAIKPIREACKW